jgi:hypothetical protein
MTGGCVGSGALGGRPHSPSSAKAALGAPRQRRPKRPEIVRVNQREGISATDECEGRANQVHWFNHFQLVEPFDDPLILRTSGGA